MREHDAVDADGGQHRWRAREPAPLPSSPHQQHQQHSPSNNKRTAYADSRPAARMSRPAQRPRTDAHAHAHGHAAAESPHHTPQHHYQQQQQQQQHARTHAHAQAASSASTSGAHASSSHDAEAEAARMRAREKQIAFGKNTLGYQRYTDAVPRHARTREHPRTPDVRQVCSKRSWDGQVRKWRRALHQYDPPAEDGEENAVAFEDVSEGEEEEEEAEESDEKEQEEEEEEEEEQGTGGPSHADNASSHDDARARSHAADEFGSLDVLDRA